MDWLKQPLPAIRRESHFGDRVISCFAERPRSVHALVAEAVRRHPEGEAVVSGEDRLTWRALDATVAELAAGLGGRGLGAGDRVALFLGNRLEFVLSLFAIARLGAVAVPLGTRQQAAEIAYVVNDCGVRAIIHEGELADRLPAAAEVPSLEHRIAVPAATGSDSFQTLMTGGSAAPEQVVEDEAAVILYTSGTTGKPKGAILSHLNLVNSALVYEFCMALTEQDRSLAATPFSHVTGLVANILAMARSAGTLVILPEFKARDFLALAAAERITHTLVVPAMYNLSLLQPNLDSYDLTAWRIGGYGGAPMPTATIERLAETLPGLQLMNTYGATETTSPTTIMPSGFSASHIESVGLPVPCCEVIVVDDAGCEVPANEVGEIWIRGPSVVQGYWNNPAATAANITGGFWHSGDIGSVDEDGFVRIHDRMKDMLNRGGFKIYSAEVENVLSRYPGVVEAAVVGKPCPVLGERVHAFVRADGPEVTPEALGAHCASLLSDYKVPESFTLRGEPLPRNANGKLMKRELREELLRSIASA